MKNRQFTGRHYETGTIANILQARGDINPITKKPYDEDFVIGASGGIAFGYFVFEYKGYLPHVALLTRNTFHPFERALDNLGIRREVRETTNEAKGEENLRRELDMGNLVVVWADAFSLPYFGFENHEMYGMRPLLVVGQEGDDFLVVDGTKSPFSMSRTEMA
ncbi:MAG: BtrH N-terminal domain-containing protein, partial [Chlorobia bacterium]|nr:BtrH N-terminal domain-containing protein [Fimbriimonadaceae bacterium]